MAVFTVFLKSDAGIDRGHAILVREGFSWGAFWLGPVWLLWRGLWLAFLAYVAVMIVCGFLVTHLSLLGSLALGLTIAVFLALEGNRWRRAKLFRKGYTLSEIVTAPDRDTAERIFFDRLDAPAPPRSPTAPAAAPLVSHAPPVMHEPGVLGLFPEPERSR